MILKSLNSPFGAALGYHSVKRIEGNLDDASAQLALIVHSWPSEESHVALEGKGPTYVWCLSVPQAALNGSQLLLSCEQALVAAPGDGSPFVGGSIVAAVTGLDAARVRQWARIKQAREILNLSALEIDGIAVDGDERSRQNILGAIVDMQLTDMTSRNWICADNVSRELTAAQLIAFGTGLAARTQALVETSYQLRGEIFDPAKTTVEAVEAVVWPVPAPEVPQP